ncbi:hypothetical protein C8R43DRAFT_1130893 [Mycena crocata]|nr:hypothetical protein C8R43DRAFT_1130893 [Mycena crocata]
MPPFVLGPGLGPLLNRPPRYQGQSTLTLDANGRLRFAAIGRRILALPPEITSEIFLLCLPNDEFICPDIAAAPLLLCGICREWRRLALATADLWSSLCFDLQLADELPEELRNDYLDLVKTWLRRARRKPLSLCLRSSQDSRGDDGLDGSLHSIFHTIIGLSPQWKNIKIDLRANLATLMLPVGNKMSLLEKLACRPHYHSAAVAIAPSDAPKLRDVIIDPVLSTYYPVQLPWSQLTTIRAHEIPLPAITLQLVYLQSLHLSGSTAAGVIDRLATPALTSFKAGFPSRSEAPDGLSSLSALRTRSSCRLHTLSLLDISAETQPLIQCLKMTPSLVHLDLRIRQGVDVKALFSQCTWHADFLPSLQSLHVSCPPPMRTMEAAVVLRMLRWRWNAADTARLQYFRLMHTHSEPRFDRAHPEFLRLQAEGMVLYVEKEPRGFFQ